VTDSEIQVGSISALSGPVPGLAASSAAAVRSYVAYRNSTGGVCGRKIVLREADDATDSGRYRAIVTELGPRVFGLVGGFTIGDVGGTDIVAAQGLPVVNGPSTDAVSDLPTVFDVFPRYEDRHAVIGKYRWLRANGATKVAIAYLAVDASRAEAQLQRGLMEAAGIQVVLQRELPVSTLSYDSAARAVANSGADYLWFIADVNGEASMARSMADTGYKLRFAEYYNFPYGTNFTELAGDAAQGTVAFLRSLPNEEAASNPEMTAFVTWMRRIAPGEDLDPFAVDSWVSGKAFFDTLEALPGPITREAFLAKLRATETFDAGGMFGPIRLGAELTNACVIGVRYEGKAWHRLVPDSGFLC
jgi:ABC-type branched-subunit amino acid transport system substrate-binding protein